MYSYVPKFPHKKHLGWFNNAFKFVITSKRNMTQETLSEVNLYYYLGDVLYWNLEKREVVFQVAEIVWKHSSMIPYSYKI